LTLDTTFGLTRFCREDFTGHWKGCNHTAQAILKAKWFEVIALQRTNTDSIFALKQLS
jgi:hypothetical protein